MATSQVEDNNVQQSSYLIAATTTAATTINSTNDTPTLCDIKLICTQRKKKSKRCIYLTFIESCSLSSTDEQPYIEIRKKTNSTIILLDDCISYEYFDTIKNDFQSFIYIYFESYTIIIYFSDEHIHKKSLIIKHLDYMYQKKIEQSKDIKTQLTSSQELPNLLITENILHTFDVKLIPYETIITRDHNLIGPARIYFTTTDLYIASIDCNQMILKTTITNQCPSKDKQILCIPYFTIKHYGNRSNIFLIELGKSNYGNGEIHMSCSSSSLASTIHLLVSPVIEERPLILSSAFRNQLLTHKRIEKSKHIHPPIKLNSDITNQPEFIEKKSSIESLSKQTNLIKSRSLFGFFRKLIKNTNSLEHSCTFDENSPIQPLNSSSSLLNKFFELNIDENKLSNLQNQINSQKFSKYNDNDNIPLKTFNKQETTNEAYIDMGPTVKKTEEKLQEEEENNNNEEIVNESTATVDIGVNTIISIPPNVHSAIIVGSTVHLIAEERNVFPIGQRSFTSPASVMQPFKAQLHGQTNTISSGVPSSPNSPYHSTSPTNTPQSLLLTYAFVTFNNNDNNLSSTNQTDYISDSSAINCRLNSDLSLMSISHQQQPSNIYSFDNILSSSSSSSRIFRTLSLSTNNIGDNISGRLRTSNGNIIVYDENLPDQTINYLLEPPRATIIDDKISSTTTTITSNVNEEKNSTNDCYVLMEPTTIENSSLSSLTTVLPKSSISSEQSINYADVLLSSNTGDEQQECYTLDDNNESNELIEEKTEHSSTILYTDIDFHQTQRRDRIAQFAAISKLKEQVPPFVL